MPNGGARPPCPVSSPTSPAPSLPPGQTRGRAGWNAALSEVRHRGPQPTAVADGTETDGEIAEIAGRIAPKQGGGLDRNHRRFEPRYAVEIDEGYVVAGHKGQPTAVAKRGGLDAVAGWPARRVGARRRRTSHPSSA